MHLTTSNQSAKIDLKQGAALTELTLDAKGRSVTLISPDQQYLFASSFLFPFPNRLSNGTYSIDGSTYAFPLNDFGRPNALHGFIHDKEFRVVSASDTEIVVCYEYRGDLAYFPFAFYFCATYTLRQSALDIDVEIVNRSDGDMPFGLGWHPYFNISDSLVNTSLKLPEVTRFELDENFIPNGVSAEYLTFSEYQNLDGISLDDSFRITGSENSSFIRMSNGATIEIWQDPQSRFLQVYTPGDQKSVAVEPMTCGVNAWNLDNNMPVLAKGERFEGSFGVRVV